MLLLLSLILNIHAATVTSGTYNSTTDKIEVGVEYSGGCGEHEIYLSDRIVCSQLGNSEQFCRINLIHKTEDMCRTMIIKTIELDPPQVERPYRLKIIGFNQSRINVRVK